MTSIVVTMPKSAGGLKHLQNKVDMVQNNFEEKGYAWWWVKGANELTTDDYVDVVCEGRLRGRFSIKWIVEVITGEVEYGGRSLKLIVHTRDGTCSIAPDEKHDHFLKVEQIGDGFCYGSFSQEDINILWYQFEDWYKEGKKCIFFEEWHTDLDQKDAKGFQGFRYRR